MAHVKGEDEIPAPPTHSPSETESNSDENHILNIEVAITQKAGRKVGRYHCIKPINCI